jgi:hypothetical protein
MQTSVFTITTAASPLPPALAAIDGPATLVLVFAAPELLADDAVLATIRTSLPTSVIAGCSTAGEICGTALRDRSAVVAACRFDRVRLGAATATVADAAGSFQAGRTVATRLTSPDLRAILAFSDGLSVNGSELVRGLRSGVDDRVVITGGLAGDGDRFEATTVVAGGRAARHVITGIGLYGDDLVLGHGSQGGWDTFGLERTVTRSSGPVLYELDRRPALDLYCDYLGELAAGLPGSALLFPLAVWVPGHRDPLVRTVLAVDHEARSLTFAGDIPQGARAQLMRANFERLLDGAAGAACDAAAITAAPTGDVLTLAISCVGRRLVLGERAEEELEAVAAGLPDGAAMVGFYSYGELSPHATGRCELHNQTMTLTTLAERAHG